MKFLLIFSAFILIGCNESFQTQKEIKSYNYEKVISSECSDIKYIHYNTQEEANINYFNDLKNTITTKNIFKPFIDSRYMFYPIINTKCSNNTLDINFTIDLEEPHLKFIDYAGVQYSFGYKLDSSFYVFKNGNGIMLQAYFNKPIYINYKNNSGGNISFILYLYNDKLKKHLNYTISIYGLNKGSIKESKQLFYDPTTNMVYISTALQYNTKYCTLSPYSIKSQKIYFNNLYTNKYNNFTRVLITYNNLLNVLTELKLNPPKEVQNKNFGLNPENWRVTLILIQFELEEDGVAYSNISFKNFEVYKIKYKEKYNELY